MSLKACSRSLRASFRLVVVFLTLVCSAAYSGQVSDERLIAVGWVQAAGEIRIYSRKSDLGKLYDGSCISGVMTDRRTMPIKFRNHYVSVYGKLVDAKEFDDLVARGITAGVENYCNSPKIAIITRIVENTSGR